MPKKIAVIGGGVSGLVTGVYAAKSGYDVEIYEKNPVAGGECTGWDRDGYYIDNCLHWLMGTTGDTALRRIWVETGALGEGVEVIASDRMYVSELDGQSLTLWQDIGRTEREMIALSPEDEPEIRALMKNVRLGMGVTIPAEKPPELMNPLELLHMARTSGAALKLMNAYKGVDTQDLMNRFKHPLIRCLISDFCTKESLAHSFPMAYGNFVSGDGGLPRGGSRALALRIAARCEALGGKVITGAPVARINLEGDRATGFTLADGRVVTADYVVCACDPSYTFSALLDPSYTDPILREVYANPADYPVYGMFQSAYAVDCAEDALGAEYMLDARGIVGDTLLNGRATIKTFGYEPSFAPAGKQIVQAMVGLPSDAYPHWRDLRRDDPAAYRAEKTAIAERLQALIEDRFPAYRGKMRLLDAWTPATYARWCNGYRGYNQAFVITKRSRKNPYPAAWIAGLQNVLLSGQWLSPPGGLPGAAIQGKYAVQRILHKDGRKCSL